MSIYFNNIFHMQVTALIVSIIIGVVLFAIATWLDDSYRYFAAELTCGIFSALSFIVALCMLIAVGLNGCNSYLQRENEPNIYQATIVEGETLSKALDGTEDVVNTGLYTQAVAYNAELAKIQSAYADPNCSMSFSGKIDWSTVPLIEFD